MKFQQILKKWLTAVWFTSKTLLHIKIPCYSTYIMNDSKALALFFFWNKCFQNGGLSNEQFQSISMIFFHKRKKTQSFVNQKEEYEPLLFSLDFFNFRLLPAKIQRRRTTINSTLLHSKHIFNLKNLEFPLCDFFRDENTNNLNIIFLELTKNIYNQFIFVWKSLLFSNQNTQNIKPQK